MITLCPCAGHGGEHRGTAIPGGPDEAAWALSMSGRVDRHIRALCRPGLRSVKLRLYDQSLALDDRGVLAEANGCTLALPIHVNAGPLTLRGMSCFVWPGDELGLLAAKAIRAARPRELVGTCKSIVTVSLAGGHWTRDARAVLRPHIKRGFSACLVECGFARPDREHLVRISTQDQIAAAITAGGLAVYEEVHRDRADTQRADRPGRARANRYDTGGRERE